MSRILKYNDAKQKLIRYIFENKLEEGAKLPSEQKLCALFETSNLPLRRAADELCQCGMLKRVENIGVFIGSGWDQAEYSSVLGVLSIGVGDFPSGREEQNLKEILEKHHCDLRVMRTGLEVQAAVIEELGKCNYIIISGFINSSWLEAVKALEKPILQLGRSTVDTGLYRIENDFYQAYKLILETSLKMGARRFLVWLPDEKELSTATALTEGFEQARIDCGINEKNTIRDYPHIFSVQDCVRSLMRHQRDYDVLLIRDYILNTLVYYRKWGELIGTRPVMTLSTRLRLPDDYDMLPGFYRVYFPQNVLDSAWQFFFRWQNRLPDGGRVLQLPAELAHNFGTAENWME